MILNAQNRESLFSHTSLKRLYVVPKKNFGNATPFWRECVVIVDDGKQGT